jgi:hypothetical protein
LLWQIGRRNGAFLLWGIAVSFKFIGGVAALFGLGLLLRSRDAKAAGLGLVLTLLPLFVLALPFALDGSLPLGSAGVYATHWMNYGSVHALLSLLVGAHPARWVCMGLGGLWLLLLLVRGESPARGFCLLFVGMVLLSPVVHPWYGLWLLVLLPLWPRWDLFALVSLLPLSYLAWTSAASGGEWLPPLWVPWLGYGIPLLIFVAGCRKKEEGGAGVLSTI